MQLVLLFFWFSIKTADDSLQQSLHEKYFVFHYVLKLADVF